jgi:hypothetical protein
LGEETTADFDGFVGVADRVCMCRGQRLGHDAQLPFERAEQICEYPLLAQSLRPVGRISPPAPVVFRHLSTRAFRGDSDVLPGERDSAAGGVGDGARAVARPHQRR